MYFIALRLLLDETIIEVARLISVYFFDVVVPTKCIFLCYGKLLDKKAKHPLAKLNPRNNENLTCNRACVCSTAEDDDDVREVLEMTLVSDFPLSCCAFFSARSCAICSFTRCLAIKSSRFSLFRISACF